MNKKATCSYLQVANNTLDKWIAAGLPVIHIDGVIRFDKQSINDWMASKSSSDNRFQFAQLV
ncbi:helix-turn-helix domain-containing protein [Loigolactobacillus coryniformis]|uniref:helix-turn-helix domain-containing protein n=1 Tax=Loigolactobacillus coryniformis TaxID=1610 RepID=UPI002150B1C2|nr:helix-turn-helix domain-containing protein [Loigolactobacillus coryniformis]